MSVKLIKKGSARKNVANMPFMLRCRSRCSLEREKRWIKILIKVLTVASCSLMEPCLWMMHSEGASLSSKSSSELKPLLCSILLQRLLMLGVSKHLQSPKIKPILCTRFWTHPVRYSALKCPPLSPQVLVNTIASSHLHFTPTKTSTRRQRMHSRQSKRLTKPLQKLPKILARIHFIEKN